MKQNQERTPEFKREAFYCPNCGAYANQTWFIAGKMDTKVHGQDVNVERRFYKGYLYDIWFAICFSCRKESIWYERKMIYPFSGIAPLANEDMPEEIKEDYNEARSIVTLSPRGAAALLRLVIQKLCKYLGEDGKNINADIGNLVAKGLPNTIQKALDSVRVTGNNAVHPGVIDLKDDVETAVKLFGFVNVICNSMITQPKHISEYYDYKIPPGQKEQIENRDKK